VQEPVYTPPPQPQYVPPVQEPVYAPPPQAYPHAQQYAPADSSDNPSFIASLADKFSMLVLLIVGGVALLLVIFSALWLFTGIFSPKADAGKTQDSVASKKEESVPKEDAAESDDERGRPESPRPGALSPASARQGFYALVEMSAEGQDMLELYESLDIDLASFYIEVTSESTLIIASLGDVTECSFTIAGNKITVTGDGEVLDGTFEGDRITLDMGGLIMGYEWDPAFVPSGNPMATGPGTGPGTDPGTSPGADPGTQGGSGIPGAGGVIRVDGESEFVFSPYTSGVWAIWTADNGGNDPVLSVHTPGGAELAWDDDNGGNYNALIGLYLIEGESYTIKAGAFASDVSYSLHVSPGSSIWASGDTVNVDNPKVFSFTPYASGTWVFETTDSDGTDPYLQLFDSNNRHIVSDDDSGEGVNARISIDLTGGEEYIIFALTMTHEPGPYVLVVSMG